MALKEVTGSAAMGFLSTRPTMIITTLHESGSVNAGVFGSWTNLSADEIGAAISRQSDTYANMRRSGEFVVNIPGSDMVKALAILAEDMPAGVSELKKAGLSTRPAMTGSTAAIAECVAAVEFAFSREVEVGHHSLMIGKCRAGWVREEFVGEDGKLDIFKARVLRSFKYPLPLYHLPGEIIEG
jgi:flavin reductase (DIM6/NTAB) family NADH-FMN oxidoreductase RutF